MVFFVNKEMKCFSSKLLNRLRNAKKRKHGVFESLISAHIQLTYLTKNTRRNNIITR